MPENNMEYRCLCSTCRNVQGCTFPKDSQRPVFNCEEFEVDMCPSVETTGENKSSAISVDPAYEASSKFMGLCGNCDNSKTCTFPKPQGGIWHCEEYQ